MGITLHRQHPTAMKFSSLAVASLLMLPEISSAAEMRFTNGPEQTSLLELYTSEGCSSCPPAEARLSRLKDDPVLWKDVVPLAYHVDYWDRLGWRDRFSSPEWTARQSRYAALWQSESVYTPAFVRDGRELRSWSGKLVQPNEQRTGTLTATSKDGRTWTIDFNPSEDASIDWEAHLALLGSGLSSKIGAGENGGRNLQHDFVVLSQVSAPLPAGKTSSRVDLTLPASAEQVPRRAIAIWVTRRGQLASIQAAGGWLAQDHGTQP